MYQQHNVTENKETISKFTTKPSTMSIVFVFFKYLKLPISSVGFSVFSMFCCALRCIHYSFAIILMGKRELVALLCLFSWCLVIVVWLFLTMPQVCLQFVIEFFLIILSTILEYLSLYNMLFVLV